MKQYTMMCVENNTKNSFWIRWEWICHSCAIWWVIRMYFFQNSQICAGGKGGLNVRTISIVCKIYPHQNICFFTAMSRWQWWSSHETRSRFILAADWTSVFRARSMCDWRSWWKSCRFYQNQLLHSVHCTKFSLKSNLFILSSILYITQWKRSFFYLFRLFHQW